jgi:hypothetical protein
MMWTKISIGSFKYSRKNIRTVCYTPLLITKIVIDAMQSNSFVIVCLLHAHSLCSALMH